MCFIILSQITNAVKNFFTAFAVKNFFTAFAVKNFFTAFAVQNFFAANIICVGNGDFVKTKLSHCGQTELLPKTKAPARSHVRGLISLRSIKMSAALSARYSYAPRL